MSNIGSQTSAWLRGTPATDAPERDSERHLPYQPALDGLRALAVAAVLLYHADISWMRGGFLGVDAFFVLSGYLITSLILLEWRRTGQLNLMAFWARRARRLLPALFLMLAGVAVYAVAFAEADELDRLRGDAIATIAYVANWRYVFSSASYFDQFSLPSPLRHAWSLAIEEQFYIVWPLIVTVLLSIWRSSPRLLIVSSVALMAGSALWMAWLYEPGVDPSRIYYGTDTRAQSLLVGSLLAMALIYYDPVRTNAARTALQVVAVVAAVAVGWTWVATADDSAFLYRGGYLVLAIGVAAVIAAVVQPERGQLARLLSFEPLRRLGLISYGVYLWHWPIYLVLSAERTGLDTAPLLSVRIALTLTLSVASYFLIEQPIRRGKLRMPRASWSWTPAPVAAAVLALVLVLVTQGGTPSFSTSETESARDAWSRSREAGAARIMLAGDSVARSMSDGLYNQELDSGYVLLDTSAPACGVMPGDVKSDRGFIDSSACEAVAGRWLESIEEFQPEAVVLVISLLDSQTHTVDGRLVSPNTPAAQNSFRRSLQDAIDLLSSGGAGVALLTAPYVSPFNISLEDIDRMNVLAREVASENPGTVTLIEFNEFLGPDGDYTTTIDGIRVRSNDNVHISAEGSDFVATWLAPQIMAIINETSADTLADGDR